MTGDDENESLSRVCLIYHRQPHTLVFCSNTRAICFTKAIRAAWDG